MKYFIPFLFISIYYFQIADLLSTKQAALITTIREACEKEIDVKPDLVLKARKGDFADDPKLKEYVLCINKKHMFVTDDGVIQEEKITKAVEEATGDKDIGKQVFNLCHKKQSTPLDTSFEMVKCYFKQVPVSIV